MPARPNDLLTLTARTSGGLEDCLAEELRRLGAAEVRPDRRAVHCRGDLELLYRLNLGARTAGRILRQIARFPCPSPDELYRAVKQIDWSGYLTERARFAVDATASSPRFRNSHYVALRTKDAIVDQFRERSGDRPSVDLVDPDLRVFVHIRDDVCSLSLDSSGAALHRRGYRTAAGEAPLAETLASGLIQLAGWDAAESFVDPMCGSGVLACEAALLAYDIAPGLFEREFLFERWPDFDARLWRSLVAEALEKKTRNLAGEKRRLIHASDSDPAAVGRARENAARAGLADHIQFSVEPLQTLKPPPGPGLAIMNPPYGERMQPEDIEQLYAEIGDALKQNFQGYRAGVLSANREALEKIRLKPARKLNVSNGGLDCRFLIYELYAGSRKSKYQKPL